MASSLPCRLIGESFCNRFLASVANDLHPTYVKCHGRTCDIIDKCDVCALRDEDHLSRYVEFEKQAEARCLKKRENRLAKKAQTLFFQFFRSAISYPEVSTSLLPASSSVGPPAVPDSELRAGPSGEGAVKIGPSQIELGQSFLQMWRFFRFMKLVMTRDLTWTSGWVGNHYYHVCFGHPTTRVCPFVFLC